VIAAIVAIVAVAATARGPRRLRSGMDRE
jgi:hypothetical protein